MNDSRSQGLETEPHGLLGHALEKVLFLESRLEAAEVSREESQRESERLRRVARRAQTQLGDWQQRATGAEVATEGAQREALLLRRELESLRAQLVRDPDERELRERLSDAEERLQRYALERERWVDRMVTLARLREGGSDELDLGAFIAELRAELLALRRGEQRRPMPLSERLPAPDPAELLTPTPASTRHVDAETLLAATRLARPDKTLARLCARELDDASPLVRRRAAERLRESRLGALNPLLLERLPLESDPTVRIAFVQLLGATGGEAAQLALGRALVDDPDPRVRAAALPFVPDEGSTPARQALHDRSPAVRRRALQRLPRTPEANDRLADGLFDPDRSVRHVALQLLATRPGTHAEELLRLAAQHADPDLRTMAAEALARRGAAPAAPWQGEPAMEPQTTTDTEASTAPETTPKPASWPPGRDDDAHGPSAEKLALATAITNEVRTALRGRTVDELADRLGETAGAIEACVGALTETDRLVWRGRKLYLP